MLLWQPQEDQPEQLFTSPSSPKKAALPLDIQMMTDFKTPPPLGTVSLLRDFFLPPYIPCSQFFQLHMELGSTRMLLETLETLLETLKVSRLGLPAHLSSNKHGKAGKSGGGPEVSTLGCMWQLVGNKTAETE